MKAFRMLVALTAVICLSGCAVWSYSTSIKSLKKSKIKYSKIFEKDASYCYEKSLEALDRWGAVVYQKSAGRYIAAWGFNNVYKNCINTTELGIFFNEVEPNKTQVEVSSLNHRLSEHVSRKLFKYIENPKEAEDGKDEK